MAPLILDSSQLEITIPTNLQLGPVIRTATTSNLQVKPRKRSSRRKALRFLRAALKYLGYSIRHATSAGIVWANKNPKFAMGIGLVIIGGIVVITFPEAAAPVLGAFGITAVGSVISGAVASGVASGIDTLFSRAGSSTGPSRARQSSSNNPASGSAWYEAAAVINALSSAAMSAGFSVLVERLDGERQGRDQGRSRF